MSLVHCKCGCGGVYLDKETQRRIFQRIFRPDEVPTSKANIAKAAEALRAEKVPFEDDPPELVAR